MVIFENMKQAVLYRLKRLDTFQNVCAYTHMHATINKKEALNLIGNKEGYMGELCMWEGKKEMM